MTNLYQFEQPLVLLACQIFNYICHNVNSVEHKNIKLKWICFHPLNIDPK